MTAYFFLYKKLSKYKNELIVKIIQNIFGSRKLNLQLFNIITGYKAYTKKAKKYKKKLK